MMKELIRSLVSKNLNGRTISIDERLLLEDRFDFKQFPFQLMELLSRYNIIGQTFSISEDNDPSGLGVNMEWFTPSAQVEEAFEYFPGTLVVEENYLPVGMCLSGSGDPYFLKIIDQNYMIFRVPHDAIYEGVYDSIEFICSFVELFDNIT